MRTLSGNDVRDATKAGINRIYWDFRYQPLPAPAGGGQGGGGGGGGFGGGGGNNGPFVMPGEYRVTLVVNGKDIATKPVRVVGDTAIKWTDADRKTWHDTALAFHRLQEQANEAADAVTQLATQYQTLETMLKTATNVPADAKTAIEAVGKDLTVCGRGSACPRPVRHKGPAVVVVVVVAAVLVVVARQIQTCGPAWDRRRARSWARTPCRASSRRERSLRTARI